MTGDGKPHSASDGSTGKPSATTPALSDQMILFHGRYGRRKFWLWSLALPALMFFMVPPLVAMNTPTGSGGAGGLLVMALPFAWLYCKLLAHRLHDLGRSGWWSIAFLLLPIVMF